MYRIRIVGPPSASGYVQASVATLLRALVLVEDIATSARDWPTNVVLRFLESDGAFIVAAAKDNEQSVLRADAVDGNTTFVQVWYGGDTTRHALEILMQHVPQPAPLTGQQNNQQRKRGAPPLEQRADWEEMCAKALKFQELVASGRYNAQGAAALVGLDYKKAQRILKRMRELGQ
jgi:hypothetical protein